jgi:hypothetical protein
MTVKDILPLLALWWEDKAVFPGICCILSSAEKSLFLQIFPNGRLDVDQEMSL